jgi:hypothetical protein
MLSCGGTGLILGGRQLRRKTVRCNSRAVFADARKGHFGQEHGFEMEQLPMFDRRPPSGRANTTDSQMPVHKPWTEAENRRLIELARMGHP